MKKILLFAAALMSSVTVALADAVSIGGVYLEYNADVADLTAQINAVDGFSATGSISFDASTKTLTLNNATIESTGDKGAIEMYTNSTLNIVSLGENALKQTNSGYKSCIRSAQGSVLNISGSGSLTITSVQWYPIATDASCKITIDNTTVDLHATGVSYTNFGINNNSQNFGDVEIIKSHVKAGAINRVNSITLTGCLIASPADAVVEEHGINRENIVIVPSEITEVELSVVFPKAGDAVLSARSKTYSISDNVAAITLPDDVNYYASMYDFFKADDYYDETTLLPNTEYQIRITVMTNEGYTFADDCNILVNGVVPDTKLNQETERLDFIVNFTTGTLDPTGINNTEAEVKVVKSLSNGQLLITRDGKTFNALGTELK